MDTTDVIRNPRKSLIKTEVKTINSLELQKIEEIMISFQRPWFVAGGWSIDLAAGEITRSHKDMDICIFREDVEYVISYFQNWDIQVALPGEHRLEPVKALSDIELPRYCLHMFKGQEFLEMLLTERINTEVIYRKNRSITMNIKDFMCGDAKRPYVNPAWQLLFKSQSTRTEDEHDFRTYIDRINDDHSKQWLLHSMIQIEGNKEWIKTLKSYFGEGGDIL